MSYASMISRVFTIKGTVILHIFFQVLFIVVYSSLLVLVRVRTNIKINFPSPVLVDILGIVTGLILAFRTQTAYERFSEGRTVWGKMTSHIQNLTRMVWVGITVHDSPTIVEKKSVINLLLGFAVATKHHLRREYGYKHDDLRHLLSHITVSHVMRNHEASKPYESYDDIVVTEKDLPKTGSNIPIEISYYIASFIYSLKRSSKCDMLTVSAMSDELSKMVNCLSMFEKIQTTPIPQAYMVHLTHLTWIYLLALPVQLVENYGWGAVAMTAVAAFAYLGILEIGQEIENPFNYEPNDLPLDSYCKKLRIELQEILSNSPMHSNEWIFSEKNFPFSPKSAQNSKQLCKRTPDELMNIIKRPVTQSESENSTCVASAQASLLKNQC